MANNRHFGYAHSYFGEDTKGHDVKAFGATSGRYTEWDSSEDKQYVRGYLDSQLTYGASALSGSVRAAYIVATNGTVAGTGTLRGAEIKARAADSGNVGANLGGLEGISLSVDVKNKTVTTIRGLEVSLDGAAGGASTTAVGILISNNSSATQTNSYGLDINGGTASGHKAFTADIRLQNGATLLNSAVGSIDLALGTIAGATSDDAFAVTVTDATTFSSGSAKGFYLGLINSGNKTGGQITGIMSDITMAGTGHVNGGYVYIGRSASPPNLTGYRVCGWNVHIEEMGATDYLTNLWLQKFNTTKGTGLDSFILCSLQGAGVAKSGIHFQGIALPDNFLTIPGSDRDMLVTGSPTGTTKKYLKVLVNDVAYGIDVWSVA